MTMAAPFDAKAPERSARLAGKAAVVTGAANGLGREIARTYAAAGAKVAIADIDRGAGELVAKSIRDDFGTDAVFVDTDVTDSAAVHDMVAAVEDRFGRIDIMTANAGILGRCVWQPLRDVSDEDFDYVMAVNFKGVVNCFKHAIPALTRAGGGAMTATASLSAHRGFAKLDAYCASKGAVVAIVRSLAADLAPLIRVNSVSPGNMQTDIGVHAQELIGDARVVVRDTRGSILPDLPVADPSLVAGAHLFLASADAAFVTGQDVVADGGWGVVPA